MIIESAMLPVVVQSHTLLHGSPGWTASGRLVWGRALDRRGAPAMPFKAEGSQRGPGSAPRAAAGDAQRAGSRLGGADRYLRAGNSQRVCTGTARRLWRAGEGADPRGRASCSTKVQIRDPLVPATR